MGTGGSFTSLEVRGLTKSFYDVPAIDAVDFDVVSGEIHGLLGENGAGKSTLCSVLAGLYRPDGGEITIDGEPVHLRSPHDAAARGIGMVYQHFRLVETFTVAENIVLGMRSIARPRGAATDPEAGRRARRRVRPRHPPVGVRVAAVGRRTATRRDRQAAVPRGAAAHPRRADRRAGAARVRPPVRIGAPHGRHRPRRRAGVAQDAGDPRPHRPGDGAARRAQRWERLDLGADPRCSQPNGVRRSPRGCGEGDGHPRAPGDTVLAVDGLVVDGDRGVVAVDGVSLRVRPARSWASPGSPATVSGSCTRRSAGCVRRGRARCGSARSTAAPVTRERARAGRARLRPGGPAWAPGWRPG